jgi:hypothetical protein
MGLQIVSSLRNIIPIQNWWGEIGGCGGGIGGVGDVGIGGGFLART